MRVVYNKGFDYLTRGRWTQAQKKFKEVLDRTEESSWKANAKTGLLEITAGKLYVQAQRAVMAKKLTKARELLLQVMAMKKVEHYRKLAGELFKRT